MQRDGIGASGRSIAVGAVNGIMVQHTDSLPQDDGRLRNIGGYVNVKPIPVAVASVCLPVGEGAVPVWIIILTTSGDVVEA